FHIETIDRFFQRAIRAFTREIGLSGGYQIELDAERVLSEAIDEMLLELDKEPELLKWFVEFARDKVQEGKHWNLKRDLMVLGKELTKERFQVGSQELVSQLSDKEKYTAYQGELLQIKYRFENSLRGYASEAIGIMDSVGLKAGDFKGQYGVGYYFEKVLRDDFSYPTNTVLKAVDEPQEWYRMGSPDSDRILSAYNKGMNDLLQKCIRLYEREYKNYSSAESVRSFLYTLGILTDISGRMRAWAESQGIFLLSDAARFLHGIIGENDAPFVYEKVGNYFHHFMIDEFQDTSGLQWKNFRPLIENSLAYNRKCLVVGDVKQSIYRWRNSDWEILSEQLPRDFNPEQMNVKGLKHNWRSLTNIVRFNNEFFSQAREIFQSHFNQDSEEESGFSEKVSRAYSDVIQEVPDEPGKEGGFIRISLIPDPSEGTWKDMADRRVIEMIEQLQNQGIPPAETAILVRSKRDGKRIADAILEYKSRNPATIYTYDVISNESLYLYNSISVRILIAALRFLVCPEDRVSLAQLVYEYNLFTG
ncbi:MAG: UvrD-helicase domain-containing protein, partial [Bacteroidales bacterium]|nr:UvrD-helicase domain-containing protein [Bacteroidales bacterium]